MERAERAEQVTNPFPTYESVRQYAIRLRAELGARGEREVSEIIGDGLDYFATTSSEAIGELMLALKEVRDRHADRLTPLELSQIEAGIQKLLRNSGDNPDLE